MTRQPCVERVEKHCSLEGGHMEYPTGIGTSDATSIHLLGRDLAGGLMGNIGFGELALWLATQQRPTPQQVCVFEAVLVSLADHGFTPTAIAARLTLYSAPDALQGAMAAGLLGGGSRFLGVTEDTGRFLAGILTSVAGQLPETDEQWDALAQVTQYLQVCSHVRRRKVWQILSPSSPPPTTHSSTVPVQRRRRADPISRTSGCARCWPTARR